MNSSRPSLSVSSRPLGRGLGAALGFRGFDLDRETRTLLLWIAFGAFAVTGIASVAAIAWLERPAAPPYAVSALPNLGTAPQTAGAFPNPSDQAILIPAPEALNSDLSQEPAAETTAPASSPETPPEIARLPPRRDDARNQEAAPLPPPRPVGLGPPMRPPAGPPTAPTLARAAAYDRSTAVYDISAHSVYLPDGTQLEAHSGLGDRLDDPRYVSEADRGATPPHLYELTLREELFHGVQALRLSPIGEGDMFGRTGLLAHTYMLGPKGDSNGCVSFKDYDRFLRAFQNGQVKRLAVVARVD
jgi:hypothetical protein